MSVNSTKLHEAHIPEKQLSFQYLESFITTADVKWGLFLPSTELEQSARAVDWALPARMYAVGHTMGCRTLQWWETFSLGEN